MKTKQIVPVSAMELLFIPMFLFCQIPDNQRNETTGEQTSFTTFGNLQNPEQQNEPGHITGITSKIITNLPDSFTNSQYFNLTVKEMPEAACFMEAVIIK